MAEKSTPPLWRQLQLTVRVVHQILQGRSGTAALEEIDADLRPGVHALSFAVLRSMGLAQTLVKLMVKRVPSPLPSALLYVSLALLCQPEGELYDAFTLVNQSVEAAKRTPAIQAQAAFINGCLRRFLRERGDLLAQAEKHTLARWNHPEWWVDQLKQDWPDHWQAMLIANNRQAPITLRVNTRQISRQSYLEQLSAAGLRAQMVADCGLTLHDAVNVRLLPGFSEGWFSVQDGAAQLAAPLLLAGRNQGQSMRVLDACAAPGGKTCHLLELADIDVIAMDVDPVRCERIHQNLRRLGLTAKVLANDAAAVSTWWDGNAFDAILVDAPCSASGIVRRHPDIRWLRQKDDIEQLAATQLRLLEALWPVLRPGGRLLYSTCSVFKLEGCRQIDAFLAHNTQARLLKSPGHLLPGIPVESDTTVDNGAGDHDGFYYALLEKTST